MGGWGGGACPVWTFWFLRCGYFTHFKAKNFVLFLNLWHVLTDNGGLASADILRNRGVNFLRFVRPALAYFWPILIIASTNQKLSKFRLSYQLKIFSNIDWSI